MISPVLRGSPDLAHGLEEPAIAHDGLGQEDPDGREERCAASGTKRRRKGGFLGSGTGQKCASSPVADDVESLPANGRKTKAPPPAVETRRCDGSDADFPPPAQQAGMLRSGARVDSKLGHRQTKRAGDVTWFYVLWEWRLAADTSTKHSRANRQANWRSPAARRQARYCRVEIQKSAITAVPGAGIGVGVCTQTKGCG